MKLDPRHLEMLAAIVDAGGLTEGAVALGKSQPSVSRSLSLLEQRVGVPLFQPGRRPLIPTELCLALAAEGRAIAAAGATAGAVAQRWRRGTMGSVRIGGTPFFMDGVVSGMLAGLQAGTPDVRIDQRHGYGPELIAALELGALDFAILPLRAEDLPDGMTFERVLPGRNVIACRKGHPLARRGSVRLAEMAALPWIAPPAGSPLHADLRAVLDGIGIREMRVSFSGGSLASVVNILAASDALTVLPYSVVFQLRRRDSLAALPVRIGDPDRHLGLLRRDAPSNRPAVDHLERQIRQQFRLLEATMQREEQKSLWGA